MKAPEFFTGAGVAGLGGALSSVGGLFGGGQKFLDDSAVRHQQQQRQIAAQNQQAAATRGQRAGEAELRTQDDAARRRVEALDRIINTFQQNLRVR